MNVRAATPSDVSRIHELLIEVNAVHHELRPDLFKGDDATKYSEEELLALLKREDVLIAVAEEEGVVGYTIAYLQKEEETASHLPYRFLYLDDLCVDARQRKKGVGAMLMERLEQDAKALGAKAIRLNVYQGNGAEAFYLKEGYACMKKTMEKKL